MAVKKSVKKKVSKKKAESKKAVAPIASVAHVAQKESHSIAGFGAKLKKLFFHPNKFLNSIDGEKDYRLLLRDYVLFYLFYTLLTVIVGLFAGVTFLQVLWAIVFGIIYSVVLAFLFPGVTHVGVWMFNGKEKFFNTYKPMIYVLMIGVIYSILTLIAVTILPIDASLLQTMQATTSTEEIKQLYTTYFSQPGVIISTILLVLAIIHSFVFAIKGIKKFQKLSTLKAIGAVILSWAIFLLAVFLIALLYQSAAGI